jgi:signal peptidase I
MLFLIVKFYVIDVVRVNSKDMNNTLAIGDALLVKRILNTFHFNDIVYFRYPLKDSASHKIYSFQRLVALPGDTLEIRNKVLFRNQQEIRDSSTVKHNYYLKSNKVDLDSLFSDRYDLHEGGKISEKFDYSFSLTANLADSLRRLYAINKIEIKNEKAGSFDRTVFPNSSAYSWNMDHFGKLYIPKQSDTLLLDSLNIKLYAAIIRDYEGNNLELRNDSIFINHSHAPSYVVRKNYYFVMGDNRDNANDSRVFGFLPENFIRGKVVKVLRRKSTS